MMEWRVLSKNDKGSITVFLSLILLLILSLIITVIEGARVATAKVYAERALTTAMDSTLAEYYGPLWEEYHIFGYYQENLQENDSRERIASQLTELMSYTFLPKTNLVGSGIKVSSEFFPIDINRVLVQNTTTLTDYQGKLLIHEAVEYMKYHKVGDGVEALLSKLSLLDTPDQVTYLMEEKLKVEEELVRIDRSILELMELFDGICTSKEGIELDSQGGLKLKPVFVKKICNQEVTMVNVGINHSDLYQAVRPFYTNPIPLLKEIHNSLLEIDVLSYQLQTLRSDGEAEHKSLLQLKEALTSLEAKKKKTTADKLKIANYKSLIRESNNKLDRMQNDIKGKEMEVLLRTDAVTTIHSKVEQLITEVKPYLQEAILCINQILLQVEYTAPLIKKYEELLNSEKDKLEEEVYKGLEEGLSEVQRYLPKEDLDYDFKNMKEVLTQNLRLLTETELALNLAKESMNTNHFHQADSYYKQAEEKLTSYQIKSLALDYSTLVLDRADIKSPIKEVKQLLQGSILDLIIAPERVSEQEIAQNQPLPSEQEAWNKESNNFLATMKEFFANAAAGKDKLTSNPLFDSKKSNSQISMLLQGGLNKAAEVILFQEYMNEHFRSFQPIESSSKKEKPSVLAYEKEYILHGNWSDKENLATMVTQILALRTVLDFVSILGDSVKREEAKLVAASLVGFTGLPFLVSITQVLILIVWSFAEALLDTCALLAGKDVPILKKTIQLQFHELFLISREFLQQKASIQSASQQLSLNYQGYLQIFLLGMGKSEQAFRSMDLMQENIRLRYQRSGFNISDCIFGYELQSEFLLDSKFLGISYVKQYLNQSLFGFSFLINSSYSY